VLKILLPFLSPLPFSSLLQSFLSNPSYLSSTVVGPVKNPPAVTLKKGCHSTIYPHRGPGKKPATGPRDDWHMAIWDETFQYKESLVGLSGMSSQTPLPLPCFSFRGGGGSVGFLLIPDRQSPPFATFIYRNLDLHHHVYCSWMRFRLCHCWTGRCSSDARCVSYTVDLHPFDTFVCMHALMLVFIFSVPY
jgi:hypothetical protein